MRADQTKVFVFLAIGGGLLALGAGAALPGSVPPTYNVAVQDGVPSEWADLSPEARDVVRAALDESNSVNATFEQSGANASARFGPYPDDLPPIGIDQTESSRTVIERNGSLLVFSAREVGYTDGDTRTVAISAADLTETLRIGPEDLSAHERAVIDRASTADEPVGFYTQRPQALSDGLDVSPGGLLTLAVADADLFVFADDDGYRTVVVSEPATFLPTHDALTVALAFGALATVPAVTLFGRRRLGWPSTAAAAVAVAVLPVAFLRIAAVGSPAFLLSRLQEGLHFVALPAVGALVCVGVIWTHRTSRPERDGP